MNYSTIYGYFVIGVIVVLAIYFIYVLRERKSTARNVAPFPTSPPHETRVTHGTAESPRVHELTCQLYDANLRLVKTQDDLNLMTSERAYWENRYQKLALVAEELGSAEAVVKLNARIAQQAAKIDELKGAQKFLDEWPATLAEMARQHGANVNIGDSLKFTQRISYLESEVKSLAERKDGAYRERNQVVAALAACYPSVKFKTNIEGWSPDWHNCVFITLPTGQASWHYHDSDAALFAHVPRHRGRKSPWDGHTTEEKYERLARFTHDYEPAK